jgi:hypothetical protein
LRTRARKAWSLACASRTSSRSVCSPTTGEIARRTPTSRSTRLSVILAVREEQQHANSVSRTARVRTQPGRMLGGRSGAPQRHALLLGLAEQIGGQPNRTNVLQPQRSAGAATRPTQPRTAPQRGAVADGTNRRIVDRWGRRGGFLSGGVSSLVGGSRKIFG